jgi:hypothetical protein
VAFPREIPKSQNYQVDDQIRVTATELDLLCKHRVNQRIIYVECKAYRHTLQADALIKLLGTIQFRAYQEGWLISTGPLGKDARGFRHEWEAKPSEEAQKLSIYTPERVVEAFVNAKVIKPPPYDTAIEMVRSEDLLGGWTLLITPYGKHWCVTCLSGGVPEGVLVYSAKTAQLVRDQTLLRNLSKTDTSLNTLDFEHVSCLDDSLTKLDESTKFRPVVEVQHGDSWADYRPARPQDFVGRQGAQTQIIHFLESVGERDTLTRVFAITGNSGMGKSSLIAKLRDRVRNQRYRHKFFIYAVDVRAATSGSYVLSSLLSCLREAARQGFGNDDVEALRIGNPSEPLEDPSIKRFLETLEQKKQVVCLVFDQFEELYSKTELFNVFQIAQRLFLSATSAQSNLALGFAWKSDSTVQQSHPAYFMWHNLADHRIEIELGGFRHSEASKAITIFERELGEKLLSSLRRQLIENSQGYPWLLKKLSIHIYEQIQAGVSQPELMDKALDVESLFTRDLQRLTSPETTCLKVIAENAPADWYKMLEASGQEILRALLDKRLVVKSGDRLNLYWDIFREFVLTGKVPSIPLTYLPGHPSIRTTIMVAQQLDSKVYRSYAELSRLAYIKERTVANVIRDLTMFGVATASHSQAKLDERMSSSEPEHVLQRLRRELKHHALTISLYNYEGTWITEVDIVDLLREINPAAQHQERTWKAYADRMKQWLFATGYMVPGEDGWKVEDQGEVNAEFTRVSIGYYKQDNIFIGDTSPAKAVEALEWLMSNPPRSWSEFEAAGYRNAARALRSLRVIANVNGKCILTESVRQESGSATEIVWHTALREPVLKKTVEYLRRYPSISGHAIGDHVNKEYQRNWSPATKRRVGNSLKQWTQWLIAGMDSDGIPAPFGRRRKAAARMADQPSLF